MSSAAKDLERHAANKKAAKAVKEAIPLYNPGKGRGNVPHLLKKSSSDDADPHEVERRMMDDLLGGGKNRVPRNPMKPPSGDQGLLTAMAARLSKLERAMRTQRDELVAREKEVLQLKRRNEALEAAGGDSSSASEIETLKRENDSLKAQVSEMESFLNDYGLVWVGDSTGGGGSSDSATSTDAAAPTASGDAKVGSGVRLGGGSSDAGTQSAVPTFSFSMHTLKEKVAQLNGVAGEGQAKVVASNGAHQLRMPEADAVPLTIYRDGILVRRGPFRAFTDDTARAFVQDLLDGYFPYEFKDTYPDGVCIELRDKSEVPYEDGGGFKSFAGEGKTVGDGSSKDASTESKEAPKIHGLADMGNPDFQMGKKEFLEHLPERVVRSGKVIEVRSDMSKLLRGSRAESRPDVVLASTAALAAIKGEDSDGDDDGGAVVPHDITTLQVKSDSGQATILIKMRYDDTVGDVRKHVNRHRTGTSSYELRTAFPAQAYNDDSQTLRDAGLVPNAVLMIRAL